MCEIIGRKKEIAELKRYYESGRAEFVAVYGRRRVGKTFLIDEVFHDDMVFHHTGLSPYDRRRKVTLKDQLQNFYFSLLRHGMEDIAQPKSWMEAFFLLERFLETCDNGSRFLRHSQIFEQLFVLINTKEVFWNIQALKYR